MKRHNQSRVGETLTVGGIIAGFVGAYLGSFAVAAAAARELRKNDDPWNLPVSEHVKCIDVRTEERRDSASQGLRDIALSPVVTYDAGSQTEAIAKIGVASTFTYATEVPFTPYADGNVPTIQRKAVRLDDDPIDAQANVILVTSDGHASFRVECPAPSLG